MTTFAAIAKIPPKRTTLEDLFATDKVISKPRLNKKKQTPSSEKVSTCTNSVGKFNPPGPTTHPPSTKPKISGNLKSPTRKPPSAAKQNTMKMSWIRRESDAKARVVLHRRHGPDVPLVVDLHLILIVPQIGTAFRLLLVPIVVILLHVGQAAEHGLLLLVDNLGLDQMGNARR